MHKKQFAKCGGAPIPHSLSPITQFFLGRRNYVCTVIPIHRGIVGRLITSLNGNVDVIRP